MRRLLHLLLLLAGFAAVAAVAARVRERLAAPIPVGTPGGEMAGPATSPRADALDRTDNLAEVRGIGPVYRARLAAAGIPTFAALAAADPAAVAEVSGVTEERAADWIAQAAGLSSR